MKDPIVHYQGTKMYIDNLVPLDGIHTYYAMKIRRNKQAKCVLP